MAEQKPKLVHHLSLDIPVTKAGKPEFTDMCKCNMTCVYSKSHYPTVTVWYISMGLSSEPHKAAR